jgi:predicted dehydrogenase
VTALGANERVQWGIIGTGNIASTFARDLQLVPDAVTVAVGSRSRESARGFAERFDLASHYGSYAELVADPGVDVVYVATPHSGHHAAARLALEAGKAVLVEKAFTLNVAQAEDLVTLAAQRDLFLMEAMWTRFLPHVVRIRELLRSGVLGDIRTVTAEHGQSFAFDPAHRMFDPTLGGGALLDLGVYPVSFASMVLGAPDRVLAMADLTSTGVDAQTSMLLHHPDGAHAVLTTTLEARTENRAGITGTKGRLEVHDTFYAPTSFSLTRGPGVTEEYREPRIGHGLRHQAIEVGRCLREGRSQSPVMPLAETVSILATMDEVRRQTGVRYPGDTGADAG